MPKYAMLMKLTEHGCRVLDNPVEFMNGHKAAWAAIGGQADVYAMTGEYDFLVVGSADNENAVTALALEIARGGEVSTTTSMLSTPDGLTGVPRLPMGSYHKFEPKPFV